MAETLLDFYKNPDLSGVLPKGVSDLSARTERPVSTGGRATGQLDVGDLIDYLRLERYPLRQGLMDNALSTEAVRATYYRLRPLLPQSLRRALQRRFLRNWDELKFPTWPVDTSVENLYETLLLEEMRANQIDCTPFIWFWPDGAPSAAVVTHDVETEKGLAAISRLIDIDESYEIRSSYQLVPEQRYSVSESILETIRSRGCEVNVHGLNHSGNLFKDRETFLQRAQVINRYVEKFDAKGFRSACMYRNPDWFSELDIEYDMSIPNVAHLEPQRGGCCTVFPYFIGKVLELPLTGIQDYSLFHILGEYSIELWKKQIDLIRAKHGFISFIIHPDYIFNEPALSVYRALLAHLAVLRREGSVWIARPGDVNAWWRERQDMRLVAGEHGWRIEGRGCERARVATAYIKDGILAYSVGGPTDRDSMAVGCATAYAGAPAELA